MKYLLPILFLTSAVFFAFAAVKYGPAVVETTTVVSGKAVTSKPVARFLDFIFSR